MSIEIISGNTIKILLSEKELQSFGIRDCSMLDSGNLETQELILQMIDEIWLEKQVDLAEERLYIEAFPRMNGGCILYLSLINGRMKNTAKKEKLSLLCEAAGPSQVLEMGKSLMLYSHILFQKSKLFYYQGRYRVLLESDTGNHKKLDPILRKSGGQVSAGPVHTAATEEHWNVILQENAVEALSSYFLKLYTAP